MKRIVLALLVAAAFSHANAQQLFQLQPADTIKNDLFQRHLMIKPGTQLQLLQPLPYNTQLLATNSVKTRAYDHMPVAVLQGYSKMPVLKLQADERMPVLKLDNTGCQTGVVKPQTP